MSHNGRLASVVTFIIATTAFLVLTSVAIVWASGLTFDPKTRSFAQTSMIVIKETFPSAKVMMNDSLVSQTTPYNIRNLSAGDYKIEIRKDGFVPCQKRITLLKGQVADLNPSLIALQPLTTTLAKEVAPSFVARENFDFGITLISGEMLEYGQFKTRFVTSPIQIHRFNSGYIYQTGADLHFMDLGCNNDTIVFSADSDALIKLNTRPSSWLIYVYETANVKEINLRMPTVAPATIN